MSLPWSQHVICKAPLTKGYKLKIIEIPLWLSPKYHEWGYSQKSFDNRVEIASWHVEGFRVIHNMDNGHVDSKPFRYESIEDLLSTWDESNAYRRKWGQYLGQGVYHLNTPEETKLIKPIVPAQNLNRTVFYHVVAKLKDFDLYFYPKDRESREEAESIMANLSRDMESL